MLDQDLLKEYLLLLQKLSLKKVKNQIRETLEKLQGKKWVNLSG
jgi:hypothetical protein